MECNLREVSVHADSHRTGGHDPLTEVIQRSPWELQFLWRDKLLFPANRMQHKALICSKQEEERELLVKHQKIKKHCMTQFRCTHVYSLQKNNQCLTKFADQPWLQLRDCD
jgi:hypothetical protein